jgi:cytoskeleton protein RodZ
MTGDTAGQARGEGPGAELAQERERQGLTEQQVAERLNLDVSVIHWIEQDDFAALGAPVFARGHLRRYAALLGLPPERLLEAYERWGTHPSQPTLIPRAREDLRPSRPPPRWPWVLGGVGGAVLLAALASLVVERWSARKGEPAGAGIEQAPPEGSPPAGPATSAPVAAPSGGAPAVESAASAPAPAVETARDVAGQVALRLTFSEDTWVEVYDGSGAAVLYDLGSRGTERTVRAAPPLSVTIGDPRSVTVYANGKRLSVPAAPPGQSLTRFSIDATGAVR